MTFSYINSVGFLLRNSVLILCGYLLTLIKYYNVQIDVLGNVMVSEKIFMEIIPST